MASCARNILAKNYQNLVIGFQITVENVGDVFLRQCSLGTEAETLPFPFSAISDMVSRGDPPLAVGSLAR